MPQRIVAIGLFLGGFLLATGALAGDNWPRFRGPNGSGISQATTIPTSWDDDDYNWQVELPGSGHSSPVVWENQIFLTTADLSAGRRQLLCRDAETGRALWQKTFSFQKHPKHRNNTFASCTPAVDAEHVYVFWQSKKQSTLTALTHEGQEVWQYELGPFRGGHGPGTSPIVFENQVIVCHDHEGPSYRLGLDRHTGRELWKVERPGHRACYSTPCVYRPKTGPPQIICTHSYEGITSIDPRDGTIRWEIKPFGTFPQRAVASPILFEDLIIAGSGFTTGKRNVVAVRPPANSSAQPQEVYRIRRGAPHIPTPVVADGLLFLWDDRGIVTCVDAETGENVWRKRVPGEYFGSPVCADGKLYCFEEDGVVVVLEASETFRELARNDLGEASSSTPAIADGVMYLRTERHLFSLGGE